MATALLSIDIIRIDGGTQPRTRIDQACVDDYAEVLADGRELPPVDVFHDGVAHWLADGFHRYHGHRKAERSKISAVVHKGTQRDAVLFSCGANSSHGLKRSNEDKRKAVKTLLADAEWSTWSDAEIGRRCKVNDKTVHKIREESKPVTSEIRSENSEPETRTCNTKHGKPTTMNVANIGPKPKAKPEASAEKTPEPEPPKPDPPATYLPEVFDKRTWYRSVLTQLGGIVNEIREVANSPAGAMLDLQDCETSLKQAQNCLKFAAPHAICPICQKKPAKGCKLCKGRGWIGRTELKMVTDEQKLWLEANKV